MLDNASFTLRDPNVIANLYSYYTLFRELDPAHWDERLRAWICTDYETCRHVLRSPEIFTADPRRLGIEIPDVMLTLQVLDPPEHAPIRQLMAAAFRAQDMPEFERTVRCVVRECITQLPAHSSVDLTTQLIGPIALRSVCGFLGVTVPDLDWFVEVSDRLVLGMDGGYVPEAIPGAVRAREELSTLVATWIEEDVPNGLVGFLLRAQRAENVSRTLLVNTVRATLHAGHSSTSRFMENAVLICLQNPGIRAELRQLSGTEAMRTAVDELMRFDGPVQAGSRFCVVDTVLRGRKIRRGEMVTVILGAANHDPQVFDHPELPDLQRKPNPHLGFGRGIHSCLGAGMALLVTQIFLEELLNVYPHASLIDEPKRRISGTVRGVASIPVVLLPAHSVV
ncbi:cytochrome P450 [Nocardia sp. NBC_01499]|uniref:cytochrome P450 n=1 Tax=Nocardia sp. NBC_01499 TaxID=2903597 RepID=UPI003866B22F